MKWSTIAPLEYDGRLDVPFNLGNNVTLCARPDWLLRDEIANDLSQYDRELLETSKYVLMQEYEADALGDPDQGWTGETPRSKQDRASEEIAVADAALWLAKPCPVGFRRVIVAHNRFGTWRRVQFAWTNPLRAHELDLHNEYDSSDLRTAGALADAILALTRQEAVWIACRTLWQALQSGEWPIRYLLIWTALEALFGPQDGREIIYRLSQRLAFFLSEDRAEAKTRFLAAKKGYQWRSHVVHGMRLTKLKPEESQRIMHEAEGQLRDSLKRILEERVITDEFNGKNRENYLDNLAFS